MFDPFAASTMAAGNVIETIGDIGDRLLSNSHTTSLVEYTASARVEPLTIVGADCIHWEGISDVLQSLQSVFTGYYLQAVALSAKIGNIRVVKTLDSLNPSRNPAIGTLAKESYSNKPSVTMRRLSLEAYKYRLPTSDNDHAIDDEENKIETEFKKETLVSAKELADLSVGKMIMVDIRGPNGKVAAQIPISIRLLVNQIPESSMTHLLTFSSEDTSLTERYHAWRSGRIGFIKDLVFCQDLISEHKKALMKDKDGVYTDIVKRVNDNRKAGFMTNNPSLSMASNLFVCSEVTASNIENKLGGKLSNPKIRERIFEATYIMIMVVIDREWDSVTFYHRGIAMPTKVSSKDLKISNKGSGPDVGDILKAYQLGNSPSL